MVVSGQLCAPSATPRKRPPICVVLEVEWAQELVWTFWQRETVSCSESQIVRHLAYSHYTDLPWLLKMQINYENESVK